MDWNENSVNNPGSTNLQNEDDVNNPGRGKGHAAGINLNMAPAKTSLNWMRNQDASGDFCRDCAGSGHARGEACPACRGRGRR